MPTNYYPPLSDLLDASAIPGDIEFIENNTQAVIDTLLGKVFYKDLVVDISSTGDEANYSLILLTKSLRQPLFGTGMELVFFKPLNGNDNIFSEFSIAFNWRWGIKSISQALSLTVFLMHPKHLSKSCFRWRVFRISKSFLGQSLMFF